MYIINNFNCWFTNVGEAFIDLGLKNIVDNIAKKNPEIKFGALSSMSNFYIGNVTDMNSPARNNIFNLREYYRPDVFVMTGMCLTEEMSTKENPYATRQNALGIKQLGGEIALIGVGGYKYDKNEREHVLRVLDKIKPIVMITRDSKTYNMYKDYFDCKKGLDCAFWVKDSFDPTGMNTNEYIVSSFNRTDEPEDIACMDNLIHPWHMQYSLSSKKTRYLSKKNLMVSDSPYEYLTLYANAKKVYMDLVHATIPSLVYGTPVKYYQVDNRRDAFESLTYINYDSDGFMTLDQNKLHNQKKEIENYIELVLKKYI